MSSAAPSKAKGGALRSAWKEIDQFWFGYGSPVSIGVFRILMGFANLLNLCFLMIDFDAWFSERGFVPTSVNYMKLGMMERNFVILGHPFNLPFSIPRFSVLEMDIDRNATFQILDPRITFALFLLTILAAILTTFGLWTRASTIVLAIGVITIQHRNALILHGGDSIMRLAAMYMAIAPSGAACSLDRVIALWKGKAPPQPRLVSLWPQRVIQFNLALIYFTTWWLKMDGSRWRDGTAIWYPSHLNEFKRFWVPDFVHDINTVHVMTYITLAVELCLGTIIFWKPARKYVLMAGLMMHAFIEYSMNIPLFAFGICSWYVTFYSGEEIHAWAGRLGGRLQNFRLAVLTPNPLRPGPGQALKAMDPLDLVTYETETEPSKLGVLAPNGSPKPMLAVGARSIGGYPWSLIPGVWRRLVRRAETPSSS